MQIESIKAFKKELKSLSKKYPSLPMDLRNLLIQILENPFLGEPLGKNCYKIRLKISSKNTGKSGGARIITYVHVEGETVTLLSIYDKSEQGDILDAEIKKRLNSLD
ncbi:MAG: hypothetical protein U5M51_16495 [Emticicia sp.]|nr:hypothetical protein [Emticicia sp.]